MSVQPQSFSIIPGMLGIILFGAGLLFILRGRPRRRGTDPHCKKCDYLLIGNTSARCPECGIAITPQTTVLGERTRRNGLFFSGIAIVLVMLTLLGTAIFESGGDIQWYQFKPAFLVMRDLNAGNAADKSTALRELIRRDTAGSLSNKYRNVLVAQALKEQATTAITSDASLLVNYLGQRFAANDLSAAQKTQFLNQMVLTALFARPQVAPGDPIPFRSLRTGRTPASNFWVQITDGPMAVDGNPIPNQGGGQSGLSGIGAGGSTSGLIPAQPPGHYILEKTLLIDVYSGSFGPINTSKLLLHTEKKDSATFDVLTADPTDYLTETEDPTLATPIQSSIRLLSVGFTGPGHVAADFDVTNIPANVAFQTYARVNGKEYPLLSYITLRKGESGGWHVGGGDNIPKPPATIDIILRSDPTTARHTVDLYEIWKGEILYPNVPLTAYKGN